ncbi:MAG: YciI family protein [Nocardioidaceae bacterium]
MAEYLALIYEDEAAYASATPAVYGEVMAAHQKFGADHEKALKGGNALQATTTATSIRRDSSGNVTVTDGAFAETKEALGGYYLIEASDLDEALEIAKQVPARFGGVELRPIMTFDD